jgi:hypothetical protein
MIQIDGEVDLLIPKRKEEFFELKRDGNTSALAIKNPTKFWQEKYLVIVLN